MSDGSFPFEGQIEKVELSLDQLVVLSSAFCGEVYDEFSFEEARAIREVGRDLSKSPAAVGAHVAKLVEADLLIQVGTRKRRSRTEALYARKARNDRVEFDDKPWVFFQQYLARFKGEMRMHERQLEAWQRAIRDDQDFQVFGTYLTRWAWLTREDLSHIGKMVIEVNKEVDARSESDPAVREKEGHVRLVFTNFFMPSVAESVKRGKKNSEE